MKAKTGSALKKCPDNICKIKVLLDIGMDFNLIFLYVMCSDDEFLQALSEHQGMEFTKVIHNFNEVIAL